MFLSNVTAPDTSPLQSNQKEIDKDVLFKEGIVVPMKTKNEVYPCKEATVTYENVTVENVPSCPHHTMCRMPLVGCILLGSSHPSHPAGSRINSE